MQLLRNIKFKKEEEMKKPILTIGLPTCHDYTGALFTARILKDTDAFKTGKVEILVVDNTPDKKYREALKGQILGISDPNIRYFEFTEKRGPAESKNTVIEQATGEYVLCIDGHILFKQGTIDRLVDFLENIPEDISNDFFTGPLEHNDGKYSTHFEERWRGEMWGVWAYDKELMADDALKPIWAQGCGLFLVKKDSWLGFNKAFNGFGAEEGYIHNKYRKAGKEVWLIPWLGWWHRFGNPDTKHYNITRYSKVRNYVIGHIELGAPLNGIYDHFVSLKHKGSLIDHLVSEHSEKREEIKNLSPIDLKKCHTKHKLSEYEWAYLLEDPFGHEEFAIDNPKLKQFEMYTKSEHDLQEHMGTMYKYMRESKTILNISRRHASYCTALAVNPEHLYSYQFEYAAKEEHSEGLDACNKKFEDIVADVDNLPEVETLFFKGPHEYKDLPAFIDKLSDKVSKYIIMHDTTPVIKQEVHDSLRLLVDKKGWYIKGHFNQSYGLTVLSREKPKNLISLWPKGYGPGTELKRLLKRIGIEATPNCSCNKRANEMDWQGIEWCEEHIEEIVDWMGGEAKKRGLPYIRIAGKSIANMAIRRAKKQEKRFKIEEAKQVKESV
jgi:glycosyltransferase involved in cell wall biosynthesis